ncbi:ABC transporter ATP-binding protein [Deminuibacter soli]|uniref:ABC transporter ATP-binding protein n=1 Tax=Deminuibacter soli TaxID=2291815 RepID=A0A3E1NP81_9BACT|nr:ABC transporter ATP-binding protein [Deminuibacter soli]RFM29723.1 ABC transporter ATP-binding protein [Deminuibacter soli]
MKKFSRIFKYVGRYKAKLFAYFTLTILSTVFSVVSIGMLGPFMQIIFAPSTPQKACDCAQQPAQGNAAGEFLSSIITHYRDSYGAVTAVALICGFIISATLLKNLCLYLSNVISAPIRSAITTDLRTDIYDKILFLPIGYFTDQRKGDIISRMTNDVGEIESSVVGTLEGLIKDPLTILFYLAYLIYLSPTLSLFLLILLPVTALIIGRISRSLKKQSQAASEKLGEALSILDETLGGMRVIKAFLAESLMLRRFHDVNHSLFNIRNKMNARRDLASPLTETLGVIVLCSILYVGARLALQTSVTGHGMAAGDLIAYIAIFALLINPAKSLSTSFFNMQRGVAAIDRVEELLQATQVVAEKDVPTPMPGFNHAIEFKNVSFGYGDTPILKNINLVIPKGKTVALVGSSGAGKSSLADLVPRFHDVSAGELLIDGVNIREYSLHGLRQHISIVTQEPILFNDTIANNIALGTEHPDAAAIEQAAKVANAYQFIQQKENGFDTNIGDRGSKLSGGERQRLTIARAVLKNPPILILDEATSSLDTESERLVQDAINNMMQNRTSIVIAHRLSTIRHADEIIVLQKGEIAERGTHESLMEQKGIYYKLVAMQEVK